MELNQYVVDKIVSSVIADVSSTTATSADLRTELDSHANMVVLDKHAFVFESTGRTCYVRPFSSDLGVASNVPIVDGAICYDSPYIRQTYVLIVPYALL